MELRNLVREFMTHEESWNAFIDEFREYVQEHHHLPDKKKMEKRGLLWCVKTQGRKIKAGIQMRKGLFL